MSKGAASNGRSMSAFKVMVKNTYRGIIIGTAGLRGQYGDIHAAVLHPGVYCGFLIFAPGLFSLNGKE